MICFITDRRPGEPAHPPAIFREPLRVTALDGSPITTVEPPAGGWTHERLEDQAIRLRNATREGADAWLGETWVGSTEV